jgi:hypothetical protein
MNFNIVDNLQEEGFIPYLKMMEWDFTIIFRISNLLYII